MRTPAVAAPLPQQRKPSMKTPFDKIPPFHFSVTEYST
jgi:hypothetical protein